MSGKEMTPYKRVMTALRGDRPDKIPFTAYENKVVASTTERELRNRGMCIVYRTASYNMYCPNVKINKHSYTDENGRQVVRAVFETPVGELTTLEQTTAETLWRHEYIFKTPDDYRALLFMIRDTVVEPDFERAARLVSDLGEDFIVRDRIPSEPIQQLISMYMGAETFSYEWADNRDEVLKLFDALIELNRKIYPIVADGPLETANYGGNVTPAIIGVKNFREYYVPHYNEAAEVLHKKGKLLGCHFDADNTLIMDAIGETYLDYIEAFDAGMGPSVKEARQAWPDKVLWLNWPSSWHLEPLEEVCPKTIKLIEEAEPCNGFIIGITENVPDDRWRKNYAAIMDGIDIYEQRNKK